MSGLSVDLDKIAAAIGEVPRVAYEAAHVYPLSAPHFTPLPGAQRELPAGGPLRLYVHIPFCRYACTFCFYAKQINSSRAQMQRYVDALRRELDGLGDDTVLRQLYVGGGTPTALPADLLDDLLAAITARLALDPTACHTVESSPESLTAEHVEVMRRRGIGRMSLGVQTLDDGLLQSVNRRHSAQQAVDACALLVGSELSVNVDLIYGFPGQTEDSLRRDIEAFAACGTHSFTLYNLRLNEHTPLARVIEDMRGLNLPVLMRWRRMIERVMSDLGFEQFRWHMFRRRDYPASGHDRAPGLNAFGVGHEVGIGASAYSHLGETIYRNYGVVQDYVRSVEAGESPVEDVFPFAPHDRRTLFVAQTLGNARPLRLTDYEQTFGRRFDDDFGPVLNRLHSAGLVLHEAGELALTEVGRLIYDLVTLAFYPDEARRWLDQQQTGLRRGAQPSVSKPVVQPSAD